MTLRTAETVEGVVTELDEVDGVIDGFGLVSIEFREVGSGDDDVSESDRAVIALELDLGVLGDVRAEIAPACDALRDGVRLDFLTVDGDGKEERLLADFALLDAGGAEADGHRLPLACWFCGVGGGWDTVKALGFCFLVPALIESAEVGGFEFRFIG